MNRMTLTTALVAATVAFGAPAMASDQLARSLGVDASQYTLAELAQLQVAIEEGDQTRVDFILSGGANAISGQASGAAQLAANVGVQPGNFSLTELVQLKTATEAGDQTRVNFITSGGADVVSTQSFVSPGQAQLAASLGLDPAEYTLAELASIAADREDD